MQESEDRLRRLARWGLAAAGVSAAALAYATRIEPTWLAVERRDLKLPRLPAGLEGLRIAHLSDFHMSRIVARDYLAACVAAAMAERPDLVLLTGDFVTRKPRDFVNVTEMLEPLAAPLGVYAVLGNHDSEVGANSVAAAVEASGARMLRNRHERVPVNGTDLWLAGIDCPHHEQYRVADRRRSGWAQLYRCYLDRALRAIP